MKSIYFISSFVAVLVLGISSCTDQHDGAFNAKNCPINTTVDIVRMNYNETESLYTIFHSTAPGLEKLSNPLKIQNIQMQELENKDKKPDFAKLTFAKNDKSCSPMIQMSHGYQIDLTKGETRNSDGSFAENPSNRRSEGGSSWAPFLAGAVAGHMMSSMLSPPVYILPPPMSAQNHTHGPLTGGVTAHSSQELEQKYQTQYNTTPKKSGFFSKFGRNIETGGRSEKSGFFNKPNGTAAPEKSSGFFGKKSASSFGSRSSSGGFFRKRR